MPLSPGFRVGSYEVVSLIGAGGMGEVYRARDLTLKREDRFTYLVRSGPRTGSKIPAVTIAILASRRYDR